MDIQPGKEYIGPELDALGLDASKLTGGFNINYNGQNYTIQDTGHGTRVFQPYGGSDTSGNVGGTNGSSYPSFNFDWQKAEQDALAKLKPYYDDLLSRSKGDVETAKRIMEEDYQKGYRRQEEDYNTGTQQRAEDQQAQVTGLNQQYGQNVRDVRGSLNQRGVLVGESQGANPAPVSGYAKDWYLDPMSQQRDARQVAIERAIQRQNEAAGLDRTRNEADLLTTKQRGFETQDTTYGKYQKALEQEMKDIAVTQMTPLQYQQEYQKYKYLNNIPG